MQSIKWLTFFSLGHLLATPVLQGRTEYPLLQEAMCFSIWSWIVTSQGSIFQILQIQKTMMKLWGISKGKDDPLCVLMEVVKVATAPCRILADSWMHIYMYIYISTMMWGNPQLVLMCTLSQLLLVPAAKSKTLAAQAADNVHDSTHKMMNGYSVNKKEGAGDKQPKNEKRRKTRSGDQTHTHTQLSSRKEFTVGTVWQHKNWVPLDPSSSEAIHGQAPSGVIFITGSLWSCCTPTNQSRSLAPRKQHQQWEMGMDRSLKAIIHTHKALRYKAFQKSCSYCIK